MAIYDETDSDGAVDASEDVYAGYRYLGAGTVVVEDDVAAQTKLTYLDSGGDLVWLDRFGRVADRVWEHYYLDGSGNQITDGTPDSYEYGYDAAGNRLWKENTLAHNLSTPVNLDELYDNDALYRLIAADRGRLNSTRTALESGSGTFSQDWALDGLGNFSGFDDNGTSQTRQTNTANEITGITQGGTTTNPVYDPAGNLVNDGTLEYTYDAWNRQVAVSRASDDSLVATYAFDGLNRRIAKTLAAGPTTDYYYNQQWQVLEERQPVTGQANPMVTQYVWDLSYIDTPVVRLRDAAGSGTYTSLYYTTDANHNVTALVDPATGDVVERYVYEPYGKVTVCDASWNVRADGPDENSTPGDESAYANEILFCGYRYDPETAVAASTIGTTGNYRVREREFVTRTSAWDVRDLMGYLAGDENLYRYLNGRPVGATDPEGCWGVDIHRDLTAYIAKRLGITCPIKMGQEANAPDETSNPITTNIKNLMLHGLNDLLKVTKLLNGAVNGIANVPKGLIDSINSVLPGWWPIPTLHLQTVAINVDFLQKTRDKLNAYAMARLTEMMDYHFPGAAQTGTVVAGGPAAWHMVELGIYAFDPAGNKIVNRDGSFALKCDLATFAHGLHALQDSWSHQGKPYLDGALEGWLGGGHPKGKISFPDYLGAFEKYITGGNFDIQTINVSLTGLMAFLSSSADKVKDYPDRARGAVWDTFSALRMFAEKCGRCRCPAPQDKQYVIDPNSPLTQQVADQAWADTKQYMWDKYQIVM